ncbi:sir2E [Acrasis kona]|uniref:Sir2E n=1 Tax=Acrasis kona TaxID=1008807 RepID=A0AAW2ZN73_9EUKA
MDIDHNNERSLDRLANTLKSGHMVLFITGAGLSVASGISTYRSETTSIWSNFIYEWGTRKKFYEDPLVWYNKFWLRTHEKIEYFQAKPNEGHHAIARLSHRCKIKVVTQNIDRLHVKTSLLESNLVEVHGRLGLYKCVNTGDLHKKGRKKKNPINTVCPYAIDKNICTIDITKYEPKQGTNFEDGSLEIQEVPRCPGCNDPALPQALLFDEKYTSHDFYQWHRVLNWIQRSAAIVFIGTSFSVGVTQEAVLVCAAQGKDMYNFNVRVEDEVSELKDMYHIIGKADVMIPMLDKKLVNNNNRPRMYYHPTSDECMDVQMEYMDKVEPYVD